MNSKLIVGLVIVLVIFAGILIYTNTKLGDGPISPSEDFLDQELNFETISKRGYSGHDDRKDYVIKDNTAWNNLWDVVHSRMSPKPDFPNINFNDEMIIAVFQGSHSTGGYSIEITKIIKKENSVEVFVKETTPSPGSMVTQAITQPYHIVKTKKADKEVIFKR